MEQKNAGTTGPANGKETGHETGAEAPDGARWTIEDVIARAMGGDDPIILLITVSGECRSDDI